MCKTLTFVLVAILSLTLASCKSLARPNWFSPGTIQEQQRRAVRFDPYPENEPGPTIAGVRPRGYENPIAEPARARWHLGNVCQ
ncbi:MAG: membrane or secreted protein [Thermoguttaceae bacterium]